MGGLVGYLEGASCNFTQLALHLQRPSVHQDTKATGTFPAYDLGIYIRAILWPCNERVLCYWICTSFNADPLLLAFAASIPFDLTHSVATLVLIFVIAVLSIRWPRILHKIQSSLVGASR